MMIRKFIIIVCMVLFSIISVASTMSDMTVSGDLNNDNVMDFIQCGAYYEVSNESRYKCSLNVSGEKIRYFDVVDDNECRYFNIDILDNNIIKVDCGIYINSNTYYYYIKNVGNNDWVLSKYEYFSGSTGPSDEGDSYAVDSALLKSLNRSFFYDISEHGNRMVSLGYIKGKTYLYDEKHEKTKMYLVKGDKVLILDIKNDKCKWYKIYFKGRKDIVAWISSDDVKCLSLPSKFLNFNR